MTSKYLYHFARTPPGMRGDLIPKAHDLSPEFQTVLLPEKRALYAERNFVYTIPAEALGRWKETDQLQSLLNMIVKVEWFKYSVEQWKIDTHSLDLSPALIRETYYFSPQALGFNDLTMTTAQEEVYHRAYAQMLNSVQPFLEADGSFINPEVLLPFAIPRQHLTLEAVID